MNELLSEDDGRGSCSELLSMDDLPDADNAGPPLVVPPPDRTPLLSSSRKRKSRKATSPTRSALRQTARNGAPSADFSSHSPENSETSAPLPEAAAPVVSKDEPKSQSSELQDTQYDLATTPTQIAPAPGYHPQSPAPAAPQTPPRPKRKPRSESDRQFSLPSKPLIFGALGLILILGVVRFWPASSGGIQGVVAVDGTLLTVGSLSLTSPDGLKKAMSFSVANGRFRSAESLPDGEYDATVVVGSPLGMTVPQLENTPFASLNGARFKVKVTLPSDTPELKLDLSASQAIPLKPSGGADAISSK